MAVQPSPASSARFPMASIGFAGAGGSHGRPGFSSGRTSGCFPLGGEDRSLRGGDSRNDKKRSPSAELPQTSLPQNPAAWRPAPRHLPSGVLFP